MKSFEFSGSREQMLAKAKQYRNEFPDQRGAIESALQKALLSAQADTEAASPGDTRSSGRHGRKGYRGYDANVAAMLKKDIVDGIENGRGTVEALAQKYGIKGNPVTRFVTKLLAALLPTIIADAIMKALAGMKGVATETFNLKGTGTLVVLTGPAKAVLALVANQPNVRAIVLAGIDTFGTDGNAIIGFVTGIDAGAKIEVPKALVNRFVKTEAWSWLGAMKLMKNRQGTGYRVIAYGQDIDQPAVHAFVQELAKVSYVGNKLRGSGVSQNLFYAPPAGTFAFATWPVDAPEIYKLIDVPQGAKFAFIGSYGILAALPNGTVMTARIENLLEGTANAWKKAATLPFKNQIDDVSAAFKMKGGGIDANEANYRVVVTSMDRQLATIDIVARADGIDVKIADATTKTDSHIHGALLGTYGDAAVIVDRNGGPAAFTFVPHDMARAHGLPDFVTPRTNESVTQA